MELVRLAFSLLWGFLTLFLSLFVLWRKLRHERVDFEDLIVDRSLIACGVGLLGGRLVYVFAHFSTFGFDLGRWLSLTSLPGNVDVVSLGLGALVFWLLLGSMWKDSIEILDYAAIALSFFLFLVSLGNVILQTLGFTLVRVSQPAAILPPFDLKLVIGSALLTLLYLILFVFLSKVEKRYRTFLWYRSKRRSAQTGFVFAAFLIGYGLFGATLGWFQPSSIAILKIGVDPILKLLVMLAGLVLLYVRSGRRP